MGQEKEEDALQKERNPGVDLLRLAAMFMVCVLHVMGPGGVMDALAGRSLSRIMAANMLYGLCYGAVDCFALISGYVGAGHPFRYSSVLRFWLQVFFYSGGITLFYAIVEPQKVGPEQIRGAFFPVLTKQYWYVTAYMGLLLLEPVLNAGLAALSKRQKAVLAGSILLVFSASSYRFEEVFGTEKGYSMLWLVLLYLVGGCLKELRLKQWQAWLCLLLYPAAALGLKTGGQYVSIGYVLGSIGLLLFLAHLPFPAWLGRTISRLGPLAFGVYLIHVHPIIYNSYMYFRYRGLAELRAPSMLMQILLASAQIFLPCLAIEAVRALLFRILHINALCRWVDILPGRALDALARLRNRQEETV